MKAVRSNIKISPHGGAVPILKKIKEFGIPQVIRGCLGKRKKQSKYGYEDVFIAWALAALCGSTRLEHISKLRKKLNIIPGLKLPSHDTLGRVMKKLATETFTKKNVQKNADKKISYTKYNDNIALNKMLIKATKRMGLLKEGRKYTLDIDATFVPTKCYDSVIGGKKRRLGYSPLVCLIGNLPVFICMRSGNASSSFNIAKSLGDCLTLLEENNIKIGRVISDAAGQNKELTELLNSKGIKYNIRMPFKKSNSNIIRELQKSDWRKTEIKTATNIWDCEIADFPYKMKESKVQSRIVCLRIPTDSTKEKLLSPEDYKERQEVKEKLRSLKKRHRLKKLGKSDGDGEGWVKFEGYNYKLIITNDLKEIPENLIKEYNKRGAAERNFDFMKNDFAWRLPPFMNMNENTVFLIAASLANNIFRGTVKLFKDKIPELRLNARLREFQFVFIDVACAYIDKTYIFYNTDIEYEKIM